MSWSQKLFTTILAVSALSVTPLAFSASGQAGMINMTGTTFGLDEQANITSPPANSNSTTTISQNTGGAGANGGMQGWSNPGGPSSGLGGSSTSSTNSSANGGRGGSTTGSNNGTSFGSSSTSGSGNSSASGYGSGGAGGSFSGSGTGGGMGGSGAGH